MSPTGTGTGSSSGSQAGSNVSRSRMVPSANGKEDVSQLKAQIQAMSEHIAFLQDQQNESAWAQGLSDEPPLGYTPTVVNGPNMGITGTEPPTVLSGVLPGPSYMFSTN
ncbi:hypothetical protein FB446DRAFT_794101 [Lentinula raphanica]|nr:hypothetical protein FB446DRAFT_794101 [Lentinula raphanica]